MDYRVFVSHGGGDSFLVSDYFVPKLENSGAGVFVDSGEIEHGDDFRTRLIDELRITDELFVLLTTTSIERPWVFAEVGAMIMSGKRIVPVRYGPTDEHLQGLGILSLLGNVALLELHDVDGYVAQLTQRVAERNNG